MTRPKASGSTEGTATGEDEEGSPSGDEAAQARGRNRTADRIVSQAVGCVVAVEKT